VAVLHGNREKGWIRLSALAGVVALPFLILLTQSRGGILALATMGLLILVQYRRKFAGLAVGALVVGVVAMAAPEGVWERLGGLSKATSTTTLTEVDEEGSAEQRFQIWRVSRAIIADYPITGVGLEGYSPTHRLYAKSTTFETTSRGRRDAHSLYLTVMAETGVLGFILFMAMIGSVFLGGRRVARQLAATDPMAAQQMQTLLVGLVGFLQACIFASLHAVAFLYLYLGVLATAIVVLGPATASVAAARVVQRSGPRAGAVRPHVAAPSRG
jgi:O-antigen ligase